MEGRWQEAARLPDLQGEDKKRTEAARTFLSVAAAQDAHELRCEHTPLASFQRGEPVVVRVSIGAADGDDHRSISVGLHYRHVNQAETYVVTDMQMQGDYYRTTIPSDYTDSPYLLQYFLELRDVQGRAWLYPGFEADLSNQPYYVIRQRN